MPPAPLFAPMRAPCILLDAGCAAVCGCGYASVMAWDKLRGHVQTVAIISVLTVLTWIYADRQLEVVGELRVRVALKPNDRDLIFQMPTGLIARIEVRGSQELINRLNRAANDQGIVEIPWELLSPGSGGVSREYNLRSLLVETEFFKPISSRVLSVSPERVTIESDQYEVMSLPVELEDSLKARQPESVSISPGRLDVKVPGRLRDRLTPSQSRLIALLAEPLEADQTSYDGKATLQSPVPEFRLPEQPRAVQVSLRLPVAGFEVRTLTTPVPVFLMGPREVFDDWIIETRDRGDLVQSNLPLRVPTTAGDPSLRLEQVQLYVDLRDVAVDPLPAGDGIVERTLPVRWLLPPQWEPAWTSPPAVVLQFRRRVNTPAPGQP